MAWILSTDRNANVRDGRIALSLAKRAVDLSEYRDPEALEALAAAYAEVGDLEQAVAFAEQGLRLYTVGRATRKADLLRQRLERYRNAKR
jgi:tetratricopeptide (TPR) repeat protein